MAPHSSTLAWKILWTVVQAAHPQCLRVAEGCQAGRWGPDCSEACVVSGAPHPLPLPRKRRRAGLTAGRCPTGTSLLWMHLHLRPLLRRLHPAQGSRRWRQDEAGGLGPGSCTLELQRRGPGPQVPPRPGVGLPSHPANPHPHWRAGACGSAHRLRA